MFKQPWIWAIIAAAFCIWASKPAHAESPTGNVLLAQCTGDAYNLGRCVGFIDGVYQARDECNTPNGVTLGQMKDVVVVALQNAPQVRHMNAAALVLAALQNQGWCAFKPSNAQQTPRPDNRNTRS